MVLGLSMDNNMKAPLCMKTLNNAMMVYPGLNGTLVHSDRGTMYTSSTYVRPSRNIVSNKVWIAMVVATMIMAVVKACGHECNQNYYTSDMIQKKCG